jgi:DNA-binding protein H-NS
MINYLISAGDFCLHRPLYSRDAVFAVELPRSDCNLVNSDETSMRKMDLEAMDFDELWLLHEELTKVLAEKISVEKRELEKRLAQLNRAEQMSDMVSPSIESSRDQPRRKYPKVLPKYCNPSAPAETWSGRGKQPRWLVAALQSGHQLEEFEIANGEGIPEHRRRRNQSS